ncbi:hypothetical protein [Trichloromonas sp.]|uniref:hypothetical protein n=1 Tax=Trichloromonas sp. TaxID=3069249 RepID=UPI002A48DAAB|nr:hypothetical protein [Trichloromonas sp.]
MSKSFLYQFIPEKYLYLTKEKKILYKNNNLKTDYLINIINEIMMKYYFHKEDLIDKEIHFNMWSSILRKNYGAKYNYYIDYLVENDFIYLVSDYYANKKSRTYKLNTNSILNVKKCRIDDRFILKKTSKEFLQKSFLELNNSPIPVNIRRRLVDDLYKIKIDGNSSIKYIDNLKNNKEISYTKYMKNYISIENISYGNIFFKFDEYGRMHTNFTVLRKHIRQNFLSIDNDIIEEIDLNNSQPLFLTVLMKEQMDIKNLIKKDVSRYIELVQNGLIYEELVNKLGLTYREDAKIMMYKVLFGQNGDAKKENKMFYSLFPNVFNFIKDYKSVSDSYKTLSHDLQLLESDFIFKKVVNHIYNSYDDIVIFTIHDSIAYPHKYKNEVKQIFDYYKRNLIS